MKRAQFRLLIVAGTLPLMAFAAEQPEQPVGLVLTAGGAKLLRANTETPLAARDGDMLFAGDGLRTESSPASFLFCPAKSLETLAPSGEVHFDTAAPKVKTGKLSQAPVRACALPPTLRVAIASQQHVGSTMTRGVNKVEAPPIPRDKLPADVLAEIGPESQDPAAIAASATVFETHNLTANALDAYTKLHGIWPDSVWVKEKIFNLEQTLAQQAAAAAATPVAGAQTFALVIGISKYKKSELDLQYANADASDFGKFLLSPRGGSINPQNLILLTDEKATTAAIRNAFLDLLKRRAGKNDTVALLVAGHGTVEVPGSRSAFILTYDSDPQDLTSTALPVNELQDLFAAQLKNVGHVILFADVCKAGTIGTIHNTTVNSDVRNLGDAEGDLFGLLASGPKQASIEGPQFGGGHGAFTYYILKGLEGAADDDKNGIVDAGELSNYVSQQVYKATDHQQHPMEIGNDEMVKLADVSKPGLPNFTFRLLWDSRTGEPAYQASTEEPQLSPQGNQAMDRFNSAIQAGRILPNQSDNAFDALKRLQPQVSAERYFEATNQLRVTLENRAQDVLLRYLSGDQNPQTQSEFAEGAHYMEAARTLTHESLYLEGREDFFQGRSLLFDKTPAGYSSAANLLEQSVRLDPSAAYAFNALGISYLEQGQYEKAIPAFRDAFHRAQHWSYPLHNEALARVEIGDYQGAIRLYQQAMKLTPNYSYLPYNLGLVYQRLNRRKDAEVAYRKAIALAPDSAEPYNALGTLKNAEGKSGDAEKLYRDALQRDTKSLVARHNLALLLASETNRRAEGIDLFRQNLQQAPDYLPSRLSLAETLANSGDNAGAIEQYRQVLALKPGYTGAHLALADLLAKSGNQDAAITELRSAAQSNPSDFMIFERIGDIEASRGRAADARAAYNSALNAVSDHAARKRIENKIKGLH